MTEEDQSGGPPEQKVAMEQLRVMQISAWGFSFSCVSDSG